MPSNIVVGFWSKNFLKYLMYAFNIHNWIKCSDKEIVLKKVYVK